MLLPLLVQEEKGGKPATITLMMKSLAHRLELPPQIFGVSEAMDDLQDRSRAKVIEIRIELGRPEVKKRKKNSLTWVLTSHGGV